MNEGLSRRRTVLITGASSGIGYEFAKLFAHEGYDLVLVARTEEGLSTLARELEEKYRIIARILPKDLGIASSAEKIHQECLRESFSVDVLVNCAGFGLSGGFCETDLATEVSMIQVNVVTLTQLTKLFLKDMVRKGEGKILNVASIVAFLPGPYMAVYYATKAYVLSFSEALAEEVRDKGVTVTALCPGPTRTRFYERGGITRSKRSIGRFFRVSDAEKVAEIGYLGLMCGKSVVIPGFRNQLMCAAMRVAPRSLITKMVQRLNEDRAVSRLVESEDA
jgi:short-subunit dehydrogenase